MICTPLEGADFSDEGPHRDTCLRFWLSNAICSPLRSSVTGCAGRAHALNVLQAMNRKKASDSGGSRGMQQMLLQQMQGMVGDGARSGGSSAMGGGSMARGQPGVNNMSEEEYVRVWEHYSKISGQPFDAQTVRGWYRQHKQFSAAAR